MRTAYGEQPCLSKPNEHEFDGSYFHGGSHNEYCALKAAAGWLDQFADAWQQKLIDCNHQPFGAREPSPLPDSPAAAAERQRLTRDRDQRRQQQQLAEGDADALGLAIAKDDDDKKTRPKREPRPQFSFVVLDDEDDPTVHEE
jgi:hypothetical protein